MALGLDQPEGDVMKRKPRSPKEGVFARGLGWKVVSRGFLIGVVTLIAFIIAYKNNPNQSSNMHRQLLLRHWSCAVNSCI